MTVLQLLSRLRTLGVAVRSDGERLQLRAPRGTLTAELRSELSAHRQELVALLTADDDPVTPVPRDRPLPLSFPQQRLWFVHQLDPRSSAYNIPVATRVSGFLDVPALQQAIEDVMARHEILRTKLAAADGIAVQLIQPPPRVDLPVADVSSAADQVNAAHDLVRREVAQPFDLAADLPLRALLVRLGPEDHVIVLTVHHIAADERSAAVLWQDLAAAYAARRRQEEPRWAPLAVQYADFAVWQRARSDDRLLTAQLKHWQERLAGLQPLALPAGRGGPATPDNSGAAVSFAVPSSVAGRLTDLGRRCGATPFMTLLSAFNVLLARTCGQDDIAVATPTSGRGRPETEHLVGFFVNTVVLRTSLSGNPSFRDVLSRARNTVVDAYAHQDLPFERLAGGPAAHRDPGRHPLAQVMFRLDESGPAAALPGLATEPFELGCDTALTDLRLVMTSRAGELTGRIEYRSSLLSQETVQRLTDRFLAVLAAVSADPGVRVGDLQILTGDENQRLGAWADGGAAPAYQPIASRFDRHARHRPAAPAVISDQGTLTYAGLRDRVYALAGRLRDCGAGPETVVGICLGRGPDLITAILAAWAAGAAYVPLSPADPPERTARLLADSRAAVFMTSTELLGEMPARLLPVICTDEDDDTAEPLARPASPAPDQLAYIIYTSGSTGDPKGVMLTHGGLAGLIHAQQQAFRMSESQRVLQFASPLFDASVSEIAVTLGCGAALIIADEEARTSPAALAAQCTRDDVQMATLPPTLLSVLDTESLPGLRTVVSAGERLPAAVAARWAPGRLLVNAYGPTEITVCAAAGDIAAGLAVPHVGRPASGSQCYVLDPYGALAPPGVPGELYVAGPGIARGYTGHPGLTAEVFIANPFSADGSRLYRTGDRARWQAAGQLEILGRADDQLKIRGYRIEPAEVEAALAQHPSVRAAAAWLARPGDESQLGAWIVLSDPAQPPSRGDLRDWLAQRLPAHLVPATFTFVGELPSLLSGKVNRAALPASGGQAPAAAAPYRAPQSPPEQVLAGIWRDIFGLDQLGVDDDFFDLGGDSIKSIQLVARARAAGLHLTIADAFEHTTVAQLAAAVHYLPEPTVAEQRPVTGSAPLTAIQHWFLSRTDTEPSHYNQARSLDLPPAVTPQLLARAFEALLSHHDTLRLRLGTDERGWHQRFAPPGPVDTGPAGSPALLWMMSENDPDALQRSLDIESGPVTRMGVVSTPARTQLIWTGHHLAVDAISWRILVDDLMLALDQLSTGEDIRLPPKTTAFRDWARRLSEHARRGTFAPQLPYWCAPARTTAATGFPVDLPSAPNTGDRTAVHRAYLSAASTTALLADTGPAYRTRPHELLLAGLARVLSHWTSSPDVLIDIENHGRHSPDADLDVSRTVGWFTALAPVLISNASADTEHLIPQVKETLRGVPWTGYGVLRYQADDSTQQMLGSYPAAAVAYNHLGDIGPAPQPGLLPTGQLTARHGERPHQLEISTAVESGRLEVEVQYAEPRLRAETIERFTAEFLDAVTTIIEHCQARPPGAATPSDFPLAGLNQHALDRILDDSGGLVADAYPLSPLQQGMAFHTLLDPGSGVYHEQTLRQLDGPLDLPALAAALDQLTARHPVLRSQFRLEDVAHPLQIVRSEIAGQLRVHDLRNGALSLSELLAADRADGFRLDRAPLWRISVAQTAREQHYLLLSHHHALLDGWSLPILFDELFTLYQADVTGGPAPQLPARRPYRDYIAHVTALDTGPAAGRWAAALGDLTSPTPLPAAAERTESGYAEHRWNLTPEVHDRLVRSARAQQLTLNTILHGAWALLLGHHCGAVDVTFGMTVSGRGADLPGVDSIVGLLINTVPARVRIGAHQPVHEWLHSIQKVLQERRADEHTPLTAIHPLTGVPASQPLFRTVVVFENYPDVAASCGTYGELSVGDCGVVHHDNHPLMLLAAPDDPMTLRLGYDLRYYDAATITALAEQLTLAIDQLATHADRPVREILLSTPAERALLARHNLTGAPAPAQMVPDQIAAAVARQPGQVAVVAGDHRISGRDLLARADAIAGALRLLGVGPESVVGLCTERDAELPAAILGIWRSGAAYLPLDPADPAARQAEALRASGAAVLVTHGQVTASRAIPATLPVLHLDGPLPAAAFHSQPPHPDSLAYVMFTSGSTGRPKPVGVSHRALANLLAAMAKQPGISPEDVVLASTTLVFDISVLELCLPLTCGARLVIGGAGLGTSPEDLSTLTDEHHVTVIQATPSAWRLLLGSGWRGGPGLRLLCGGEQLPRDLADRLAAAGEAWNLYGPTETTIWSTAELVAPGDGPVPIGRPIANTTCHVLDQHGRPCPAGAGGELYIGGAGLARGYLGRPDLTAERFIPDPFGPAGARLYRTGDLARRLPDGRLEFTGRADDQIKLRGHRVEPGEIETILAGHPEVTAAAVTADRADAGRLVAYVVPARAPETGHGTRAALQASQVSEWGSVWDTALDTDPDDPAFDISGWVSGITGEPIPADEMRVCVDATVERIRALQPRRILEIGCGTGLLLWQLAPGADSYTGTDLAERTLRTLGGRLSRDLAGRVQLLHREATDVSGLPERSFDVVVLNSVVQYFPDAGYLRTVCERVLPLVRPGGHVFIGDVRSLPLLRAYHTAVALANAPRHAPPAGLRETIGRGVREENELVLDPRFFTDLAGGLPGISHVAVMPKQRRQNPELSHLRYDVLLQVNGDPPRQETEWLDWHGSGLTPGSLRELLRTRRPARFALAAIPNSRVLPFTLADRLVHTGAPVLDAPEIAERARGASGGIDPEDLITATDGLPYRIELSWLSQHDDGAFDAVLSRADLAPAPTLFPAGQPRPDGPAVNDPLAGRLLRHQFTALEPRLRAYLATRLPPYLVPSIFMPVEALPLTRNGKLDRAALPLHNSRRPGSDTRHDPPQTATEQTLADVWRAVLGIARIGRDDDFFALGGHSLLATQVVGQVREALAVDLPLRTIFEFPVLANLAATIERTGQAAAPVPRADRSQPIPLSFDQQRLWFLHQLEPGSTEYNVPAAVRFTGHLDTRALAAALSAVVERHEVLRTTFGDADGIPAQIIRPASPVALPVTGCAGLDHARRLAADDAASPFDLAAGPLLRARLFRLAADDHVLSLVLHHMVADQWSMSVLTRELATVYGALAAGRPAALSPLPLQYADVATWQRQSLSGENRATQLAYWRSQLSGLRPVELPTDRPRPPRRNPAGAAHHFTIPAGLAGRLRDMSRSRNATLFMTLLSGFSVLLSRYCRQDDIAVGTPVAGRTHPEMENLIGFFVRTLVLRADLSGDPTFVQLLDRTREMALGAYAHQDVPFEQLVDELTVHRDMSRHPLFDVMFSYEDAAFEDELTLPGLRAEPLAGECTSTVVDLTLNLTNTGRQLDGAIEYRTDVLSAPTIERMSRQLTELLEAIAREPDRRLSSLPLLGADERDQILGWSRGPTYTKAAVRKADPGRIAVITAGGTLSHGELDRRANAVAHQLRAAGVGEERIVGLNLPRGADLVTAILATWKAGGACLPLDPDDPAARRQHLLDTSRPSLVLTELPHPGGAPQTPPACPQRPDQAAMILYTSGSTGLAKPVTITRANLAHIQMAWASAYGHTRHTWLSTASAAFDVFTGDILRSIGLGGTLVLADSPRLAIDPPALERTLADHAVTACELSPHALGLLCTHLEEAGRALATLQLLVVATSAYPAGLHHRVRRCFPHARVVTAYGLTEATVDSTIGDTSHTPAGPSFPIGRPLAATSCAILDPRGQVVPAGVPGELYVGGPGVARGYSTRPDLTAERFLPDALAGDGSRVYRTGDLARWTESGRIEFIGRADDQLNHAGHRIEPAEIETILAGHPDVGAAAVSVRPDPAGEPRLIAWLSPTRPAGIRDWAAQRLPAALVPAIFGQVTVLPVTSNGKLDRRALPDPGPPDSGGTGVPDTATERALARIWARLLGTADPGPQAGFFALGGHSLAAVQLVSRIRAELGIEVPLRLVFERPLLRDLAAGIDDIHIAARPAIHAADRSRPLPLSFGQQRLWFLQQLEPASTAYNVPTTLRLLGQLHPGALAQALSQLTARHQVLRTTFDVRDGSPVQVIHDPAPVDLPVSACRSLEEAQEVIMADARLPFDLAAGPPLRARLIRLGEQDHILALVLHHILSDEWSATLLRRELSTSYRALTVAGTAALPPLPIQYADYAAWQRTQLPRFLADQLDYWKSHLAGLSPLELPADRPRPRLADPAGAVLPFEISPPLASALRDLSAQHGVTLFMTLVAAFQALLARYAGHGDIAVGTPVSGRAQAELEELAGFFVNTLVLRTDLSGDPAFTEILARVRRTCLDAYSHQDVPFESLVDELNPPRDLSRTPLIDVMIGYEESGGADAAFAPGVTCEGMAVAGPGARYDLMLNLADEGSAIGGLLTYRTSIFTQETIDQLAGHFGALLAGIAAAPGQRLSGLPLLTTAQEQALATCTHGAAADRNDLVPDLIAGQAARRPQAPALITANSAVPYGEMMRRADLLARQLMAKGVGPDTVVGICLDRGADLVVTVLGIWRAGGAYLPLDPRDPADRQAFLIHDSGTALVVTAPGADGQLPGSIPRHLIGDQTEPPQGRPLPGTAGDQLAYVMYTSGSTGRPKGVAITHAGLANVLLAAADALQIRPADRVLATTTLAFDIAMAELAMPLMRGGTVHIADSQASGDPAQLRALAHQSGTTVLQATPTLWRMILDQGGPDLPSRALCTGEAVPAELAKRLAEQIPEVWNLYGPTETTIWSAMCRLPGDGAVPIGTPLANTSCHVVDAGGRPVPAGLPGELLIGGRGLARGYTGQPGLTAERFVADPFAPGGGRLYRSGDLVRWRADGQLEYLGRLDDQLKIRGFRVEPGEVETVIAAHPGVASCAAAARPDPAGGTWHLSAWVVPANPGEPPDHGELQRFARQRLPGYLVPSRFAIVPSLPLTAGGKIDRRRLPDRAAHSASPSGTPPRTYAERALAGAWRHLLGTEQVSREDDFFALGGHSLLAAQLVSRVSAVFGTDLPLRQVFERPVLADMAESVGTGTTRLRDRPITATDHSQPAPLSLAQERLWFLSRLRPDDPHNVALSWRLTGRLAVPALRRALTEIVARHEILRTVYLAPDGTPRQHVLAPSPVSLPVTTMTPAQARSHITTQAQAPFDLSTGPVLRAELLRISRDDHVLNLVLPHLAVDEWSAGVLVHELAVLYRAFTGGTPAALAPLPVRYRDYAHWQREGMDSERSRVQLSHWRGRLAGISPLRLPTDRPHPDVRDPATGWVDFEVTTDVTHQVGELARSHRATMFMAVLAAFTVVLSRACGQHDVTVGTPVSGRRRPELEPLIGLFIDTVVLRTDLSGHPDSGEILERVRGTVLDALAHQQVPLERLIDELGLARDRSRHPLFQVMINYVSDDDPELAQAAPPDLPGVTAGTFGDPPGTSPFDLRLVVRHEQAHLHGALQYRTDIFDRATVQRLAGQLKAALAQMAGHPGCPVQRLPLTAAPEQHLPRTAPDVPATLLPAEIDAQIRAHPARLAVSDGQRSMTYAELGTAADRVAAHLAAWGAGPEFIVALALPPTIDLVIGVLGVWRAGGAYIALGSTDPLRRLTQTISASGAGLILSTDDIAEQLPASAVPVTTIGAAAGGGQPPPVTIAAASLAYLVRTSGSTGHPKVVAVTHGNLAHYTHGMRARLNPLPGSSWALPQPLTADLGLTNLVLALSTGGRLHVLDPAQFVPGLIHDQPDYLKLTPTHLDVLLTHPEGARGLPRTALILGGETAPSRLLRQLTSTGWTGELHGHYGPAEATIGVTEGTASNGNLVLGRELPGMFCRLADEDGRVVPAGVAAEICIGGPGVTRGYAGRPELTAERFVPDPDGQPGSRLYRTGDLGRRRTDGQLEFLGRIDDQISLSAHRIEPAEVESVLTGHPDVTAAAVGVRPGPGGRPRLTAWLAPAVPPGIRAWAQEQLPSHLVPAIFTPVPVLPLTPAGKVDRSALTAPADPLPADARQAPRGGTEAALAGLWADVLGTTEIGRGDNFFDLGGHSLLATMVIARLPAIFGVELPLTALFDHPTVGALAQAIRTAAPAPPRPAVTADRSAPLPASFAQRRLWLLNQMEPGSPEYNVPTVLRVTGTADPAVLRRALTEIVARHESLRTTFDGSTGEPVQVIREPADVAMPVTQVSGVEEAERLAAQEAARPFDLAAGPMLRARLLRLAHNDHVLVLCTHHIASDQVSGQVLRRELTTLAAAFSSGQPSPLPPLAFQYADATAGQRSPGELASHLGYWREQLADLAPLQLPASRARPPARDSAGSVARFTIPAALAARVRALGRERNATSFMSLLAAFAVLLSRYCRQDDIAVGTPVAGRTIPGSEALIGSFANSLVLRSDLSGDPSFMDVLDRVRAMALDAFAHQDTPFEALVEDLAPPRDLSRNPLFDVMFSYRMASDPTELALPGASVCGFPAGCTPALFDLILNVADTGGRLDCAFEFRTALFGHQEIARMGEHFRRLLASITDQPHQPVRQLAFLSGPERRRILRQSRGPALTGRGPLTADPARIAVTGPGGALTHAELARQVAQLACHLREQGVHPESVVALRLPRSIALVTAILATWQAGGAYLALDPGEPPDRQETLLRGTVPLHVLDETAVPLRAGEPTGPAAGAAPRTPPDASAVLLYTSGSTGTPKAVAVSHANLEHTRKAWAQVYGRQPHSWLSTAPAGYDVFTGDILRSVLMGGTMVIADTPRLTIDPPALAQAVERHAVTALELSPHSLALLTDHLRATGTALPRVRLLAVATSPYPAALHQAVRATLPNARILTAYGLTETTIDSTSGRTDRQPAGPFFPIGAPLPGTSCYILDRNGGLVPDGIAGELFVGGDSVARGYRGRPDLTAERFVASPFTPGQRLYRTGDLVRRTAHGPIEFLGRIDDQLNLAGHRIEPGEIEAILAEHPQVTGAAVTARPDPAGHDRLVAWIVPQVPGDLRSWLSKRLPTHLIPAVYTPIDHLHRGATGKIDRRALPEPDTRLATQHQAPVSATEQTLARIWTELLGVQGIGRMDDFFALGGHSLLAAQLVARVHAIFGSRVPLRTVFEYPVLAELAGAVADTILADVEAMTEDDARQILQTVREDNP